MMPDDKQDFSAFSGPDGNPTEAERRLVEAARKGKVADCFGLEGFDRRVSAALIAALATNDVVHEDWPGWSLHPVGLDLADAEINERLVLAFRRVPASLRFRNCDLNRGFDLDGAVIAGNLVLLACRLHDECRMMNAEIAGQFGAEDARFANEGGDAVQAQGAKAVGWFMDRAEVVGCFNINGADIAGPFRARGVHFGNEWGDAIDARGVKAAGWFMQGAEVKGGFYINGAEIAGQFGARAARFANEGGDAVQAQGVKAADWFMDKAEVKGGFDINGGEIAGQFSADDARFANEGGAAVQAYNVKAAGWFMRGAGVVGC